MKRVALFLLSIVICAAFIAGCSAGTGKGVTTVTFMTWNPADVGPNSPIFKIIESFEKENPDIKIKYVCEGSGDYQNHLRVELMGNNGPDVFGVPTVLTLFKRLHPTPSHRRRTARSHGFIPFLHRLQPVAATNHPTYCCFGIGDLQSQKQCQQ